MARPTNEVIELRRELAEFRSIRDELVERNDSLHQELQNTFEEVKGLKRDIELLGKQKEMLLALMLLFSDGRIKNAKVANGNES
jgi:vacuolar-type H+-ATPase subunit D/Vma8